MNEALADHPSDNSMTEPVEKDPVMFLQFAFLLEEDRKKPEGLDIFDRAMLNSSFTIAEMEASKTPLPSTSSKDAQQSDDLKIATLDWLGIYQSNMDYKLAISYFDTVLALRPKDNVALFYKNQIDRRVELYSSSNRAKEKTVQIKSN